MISPATSVVIPALAFRTPFINTIQPSDGGAPSDEVKALLSLLEGAVFTENDLDAILDGELRPEEAACERAFARLGYRADGKMGPAWLLWRDGWRKGEHLTHGPTLSE